MTHVEFRKWDGYRHWTYDAVPLGTDEFGTWLGGPPGTVLDRPDLQLTLEYGSVVLVPRDAWWVAAFNADAPPATRAPCEIYIDISTVPEWEGDRMTAVDLDLDVIRRWDGTIALLDEDEFAEHLLALRYPPEVVAAAEQSAQLCQELLHSGAEPFAEVFRGYLERVSAAPAPRRPNAAE